MIPTDSTSGAPGAARILLKDLQSRFEVFRDFAPLAIGIDRQLVAQQPDVDRKALRTALRNHTQSTRYLKEVQTASVRRNLDGSAAGEITDEARSYAAELLRERFRRQAEQRRAAEAAAKAAEAEAMAEQRRQEKLTQLAEKFGRKAK